jgi:large subunit ribosomal protein L25
MAVTLNAQERESNGKGAARKLRRAGKVPAVVYGHGERTMALALDALELEKLLHGISVENTLVSLSLPGGGTADVLIRDVQTHPVKANVVHVDFLQIHANEAVKVHVPVRLSGTPVGVRDEGGVMDVELHDLEIECLPGDIPDAAEVDVSHLHIGESLRVRDVSLPGATVLTDPEVAIVTVHQPRVHDLDAEPGAQEGAGGGEPEVIREKARPEED